MANKGLTAMPVLWHLAVKCGEVLQNANMMRARINNKIIEYKNE